MRGILLWLILLVGIVPPGLVQAAMPTAERGVIDLRGVDLAHAGSVDLAGEWGIVAGSDPTRAFAWTVDRYLLQPGPWNGQLAGIGNASLVLRVLLPENAQPLALAIPDINSAWRLHVDGVLLASVGQLGLDADSEVPVRERLVVPLPVGRPFVDLVFEISNHHHFEGGVRRAVRIGPAEVLAIEAERLIALPIAAFGALTMISLIALAFYVGGKRIPAFIVLALFTTLVAGRTFAAAQLYVLIGHDMRADLWYLPVAYATLFVFPGIYFGFLREVLPAETPRYLAWAGYGLAALMSAVVILTPPSFYTAFRDGFMLINLATPVIGLVLMGRSVSRRRVGAGWLMAGSVLLLAAMINDILHYVRLIHSTDMVSVGFAAFATCYFAALALRMFRAERLASERLEVLNHDLEGLVAARTASLVEAAAAAERASRAKSEFLAVMSHEIRTPLHGWVGLTELLWQSDLDDEQRKYVRLLRRAAQQLARLIGNILELAGMETGRIEIALQPLRLDDLIEEMTALVRAQAGDRGQGFEQTLGGALPVALMMDESALLQVLRTLMDRFGGAMGQLSLGVSCQDGRLVIDLSGPARQDMECVGDGDMGQALCKNLVEAMDGTLSLHRADDCLQAQLRLPLTETAPPKPKRPDCPRHVRVLVADDVELNRLVLRGFLTGVGWSVDEAADGRQAVDKAMSGRYDLIVLDLRMPVMDGFAAARLIRRYESDNAIDPIPIVALSAGGTAERRQACEAGFNIFLAKPIGPDALVTSLSALLPDATLPPPPCPPAGLEHLMPTFLAEMDKDAELLQQLHGGEAQAFADHVHAMRGKCGMFGEDVLYDKLSELEHDVLSASQSEFSQQVSDVVERVRQLRQYQ